MSEFKIELCVGYNNKYRIYRKEYKFFGLSYSWQELESFSTLESAEQALAELKLFPKYYDMGAWV